MNEHDVNREWTQEELADHVRRALGVSEDWIRAHPVLPQGFKHIGPSPLSAGDIQFARKFGKDVKWQQKG